MVTIKDYWQEATSLQGRADREKQILQEIIDEHMDYHKVRLWTEMKDKFGPVHHLMDCNPLCFYMKELTGEQSWWIQWEDRYGDPHYVIGVAESHVVHLSNHPNQGELPSWAQNVMHELVQLSYVEWIDREKFLAILYKIAPTLGIRIGG